jgi:hypothetical protein
MQYYYCSDLTTFNSKIDALQYSITNKKSLYFYYDDNVFSNLNWTIEPPNTLEYYYVEQAKRIRDNYDYVILCYSGGYDSTNVLETFHYNNIKLDKIVIQAGVDQDVYNNSDENHNGELYHNAFPYVKELGLENIVQLLDHSKLYTKPENFSILKYDDNWVDQSGGWFSPHHWMWYDLEDHVIPKELRDKRVAIIFGKEKPALFQQFGHPENIGFYFRDTPLTAYGGVSRMENCDRINFYWDSASPNILLKQLHILHRLYKIKRQLSLDDDNKVQLINEQSVNSIVYNLKRKLVFKSPKSKTNILAKRDNFLLEKTDSSVYQFYQNGIRNLENRINPKDVRPIFSRFYSLGA